MSVTSVDGWGGGYKLLPLYTLTLVLDRVSQKDRKNVQKPASSVAQSSDVE